jgi:hypothetical protein
MAVATKTEQATLLAAPWVWVINTAPATAVRGNIAAWIQPRIRGLASEAGDSGAAGSAGG